MGTNRMVALPLGRHDLFKSVPKNSLPFDMLASIHCTNQRVDILEDVKVICSNTTVCNHRSDYNRCCDHGLELEGLHDVLWHPGSQAAQ